MENKSNILVVDDDKSFRSLLVDFLKINNFNVDEADSVQAAKKAMESKKYGVVLIDIIMPDEYGTKLLEWINRNWDFVYTIMISGTGNIRDVVNCIKSGAYDYITKPIQDIDNVRLMIEKALEQRSLELTNLEFMQKLTNTNNDLEEALNDRTEALQFAYEKLLNKNRELVLHANKMERIYLNIITFITDAMEYKDGYTAGHSERVRLYTKIIAEGLKIPAKKMKIVERAAKLHDIGKLVIEIAFINKKTTLSPSEWKIFKKHPETGYELLKSLQFLDDEAELILHHHERYDGTGYPRGLKKSETPFTAYIIALADSLDAMLSKRSYKRPLTLEESIIEIKINSGKQFHPEVVKAFLKIASDSPDIIERIKQANPTKKFDAASKVI